MISREARQESFGGMGTAVLVAVFGILAVLILEFGSFRSMLIVAGVIPLGIAGGVLALLVTGNTFSFTAAVGLVALLAGGSMLQSVIIELVVPVLGPVKLVTSLFFDIGVFLVVVGLVLDVLRSLGAEIDRHSEGADAHDETPYDAPVGPGEPAAAERGVAP